MGFKGLATLAVGMLAVTQALATVPSKPASATGANRPAASHLTAPHSATPHSTALSSSGAASSAAEDINSHSATSEGGTADYQPPHITVANPPAAPAPWSWQEQVAWGANIVLAILGYVGIMMCVSLLKKIGRQTEYAETAANAAAASAQAALLNAQSVVHAERPWILISVESSRSQENSFTVVATNRGKTPAEIISTLERTRIVVDERRLPATPEYKAVKLDSPQVPVILLPGEFTAIQSFSREDVKELCDSEERLRRIETWEEKLYLYGKIIYKDLISPPGSQVHETNWCCWYIHGRQNSGLVMAGPQEYNSHT